MEKMERRFCFFVGNRELPAYRIKAIRQQVKETLDELIAMGIQYYFIGGEPGFETLAAEEIVRYRMRCPESGIQLVFIPPTETQRMRLSAQERQKMETIRWTADQVFDLAAYPELSNDPLRKRWIVECSSACVTYFSRIRDCSSDIIQYAQRSGLHIVHLSKSLEKR